MFLSVQKEYKFAWNQEISRLFLFKVVIFLQASNLEWTEYQFIISIKLKSSKNNKFSKFHAMPTKWNTHDKTTLETTSHTKFLSWFCWQGVNCAWQQIRTFTISCGDKKIVYFASRVGTHWLVRIFHLFMRVPLTGQITMQVRASVCRYMHVWVCARELNAGLHKR